MHVSIYPHRWLGIILYWISDLDERLAEEKSCLKTNLNTFDRSTFVSLAQLDELHEVRIVELESIV